MPDPLVADLRALLARLAALGAAIGTAHDELAALLAQAEVTLGEARETVERLGGAA